MKTFSAYVEWDPESALYVGIVPGIPGVHTQAATLDELQKNLDAFVQDYNSTRMKRVRRAQATNFPAENFPVDL